MLEHRAKERRVVKLDRAVCAAPPAMQNRVETLWRRRGRRRSRRTVGIAAGFNESSIGFPVGTAGWRLPGIDSRHYLTGHLSLRRARIQGIRPSMRRFHRLGWRTASLPGYYTAGLILTLSRAGRQIDQHERNH